MRLFNKLGTEEGYKYKGHFKGWVINEGGHLVIEWLQRRVNYSTGEFVEWRLRFFVLGLSINVQWKDPFR